MPDERTRSYWESRAGALAWRINAATWFERVAPLFFYVACAIAISIYAFRRVELPLISAWVAFLVVAAAVGSWVAWRSRHSFFDASDARVFLESQLRLETRLTAAKSGLVSWPQQPGRPPTVLRWQPRVPAAWVAGAVGLVILSLFIPVPGGRFDTDFRGPPPALVETKEMLQDLKEMNVADPQALDRLEERAEELSKLSPEEQYKHAALEAADALKNQVAAAKASLANGLENSAAALDGANAGMSMKESAARLGESLAGLSSGVLPADASLLSQIPGTVADLSALSPEARAALAAQLKSAAGKAGQGNGQGKGEGKGGGRGGRGNGKGGGDGDGDKFGDGQGGQPGSGGPGGGGPPADLSFATGKDAGRGNLETAGKSDLSNIALGDKIGQTSEAPTVDPSKVEGPGSAGAIAAPALGGEAAWVNRLTPSEKAAVKSFFK